MLQQSETGLVIVDIQGKLARIVHDSENVISQVKKLIQGCQLLSIPIIWLEQNPEGLGATVPEIASLLEGVKPLTKYTFNACDDEGFVEAVENSGRKQWLITGVEAHVCVYQTASGLMDRDYHVEIVGDGVSSRKASDVGLAIDKLQSYGAKITNLEMCLFELVKDSRNPEFKEFLKLLK